MTSTYRGSLCEIVSEVTEWETVEILVQLRRGGSGKSVKWRGQWLIGLQAHEPGASVCATDVAVFSLENSWHVITGGGSADISSGTDRGSDHRCTMSGLQWWLRAGRQQVEMQFR